MNEVIQIKPQIGTGIFTYPDIALILGVTHSNAFLWLTSFSKHRYGRLYTSTYSWKTGSSIAYNFNTLIELFTFYHLSKMITSTRDLIIAHDLMRIQLKTLYPFANKLVLEGIDGKRVHFDLNHKTLYSLKAFKPSNFNLFKEYISKLEFNSDAGANRYWPLGKGKSIVCDPENQFGTPIIFGTNIHSEVLYKLYLGYEPVDFIACLYGITAEQVQDAIDFHKAVL